MKSFLERLAVTVLEQSGNDLRKFCIVFPTRRAGVFFRRELSRLTARPLWAPAVFAIQDFIPGLSEMTIPDPITLRFELFRAYGKYFPGESFDRFYPWGDILLGDFNDVDAYLADPRKVFSLVRDLKDIDEAFGLPPEEMVRIRNFWEHFFNKDISRLQSEFIGTWEHLHSVYQEFRGLLSAKGHAYEGMAYRFIAESSQLENHPFLDGYNKVCFAGFYALSPAEATIIRRLVDTGKAEVFFDADTYYVDNPRQEAGTFLRNSVLTEKEFRWKEDYFGEGKKKIEVTGVPLLVGQAKYAGNLVNGLMKETGFRPEETAIVLPDEQLLLPLLYALPGEADKINVTMGYPLHATPLYHLFESLISLQENAREEKDAELSFYFRDITAILNHPYIRLLDPDGINRWMHELHENQWVRVLLSDLTVNRSEVFGILFRQAENALDLIAWCRNVLIKILGTMQEQEYRFHRIESEFIFQFYTQLNRLEDIFREENIVADTNTFWSLFREIVYSSRIPFAGEPLEGLQVMGFLETRVLDFKNVIILSLNEDVLPATGHQVSFIPYNLRRAFGLPTYEDKHAVSAYHFFRLLQRAENIHLLYNTESASRTSGECSRFIRQLENELVPEFQESISFNRKLLATPYNNEKIQPVIVEKNKVVQALLDAYLLKETVPGVRKFSASALSTYISCSLKFYFKYIAGLSEKEELREDWEAAEFGKVLHAGMQVLYRDAGLVTEKYLKAKTGQVANALDEAIHSLYPYRRAPEGKNILLRSAILDLMHRIIELDAKEAPFNMISLEQNMERKFSLKDGKSVVLMGILDRVDEKMGVTRVLDYKTGRIKFQSKTDADILFSDPELKEQFQATMYAGILHAGFPKKKIKSALITLRAMSEGVRYFNDGAAFLDEDYQNFDTHLDVLISEIFNPTVPFRQTDDESRCLWCPYKEICNR